MKTYETEAEKFRDTRQEHISYSQIQTYLMCPQRFYYNYVIGVPVEAEPEALVFGRHIHYAVSEYYRYWQKRGLKMPLEELQGIFVEGWREEPAEIALKNGNSRESLQKLGLEMLCVFHEQSTLGEVIGVESEFSVPLYDLETGEELSRRLVGSIDLIERDEVGDIIVVELKTSGRMYSQGQVEYSHQPNLYIYALEQMGFIEAGGETKVRYDILIKSKEPKLQRLRSKRRARDIWKSLQLTREILRAIKLQVFYRNNGWQCEDCQFRALCE